MTYKILAATVALLVCSVTSQTTVDSIKNQCKNPTVEQRRMADDVRYASPFYVLALPRTPKTEQIDNVCYTYYDNKDEKNSFFHVMSTVYRNQSNTHYKLLKQDILERNGLAEAKSDVLSSCTYHDYTLVPICNFTVFILYRCFIEGDCKEADIGRTSGVDVRVVLAASTNVSEVCRQELEDNLRNTTELDGGDYVMLPQAHKPQCVTSFGDRKSLNHDKALGSISVKEENNVDNRFGQTALDDVKNKCKKPQVEERRMAADVRYASPFYVLALPRTPKTEQIDNVCYTYYDNNDKNNSFFHVISTVYKNQSNSYYKLSKQDIFDRNGLAEARGNTESSCTYHDHTLVPICNFTVFILYRCFLEGDCKEADIGRTSGVDVRVVLAASTNVSEVCRQEIADNLRNTSELDGGDYVMLPQAHKPQCVTSFGDRKSLNHDKALGFISVKEENNIVNRLGDDEVERVHSSSKRPEIPVNTQFLSQYTPITNTPKKTYAEAVKTPSLSPSRRGVNVIRYEESKRHSETESCDCT